MAQRLPWGFEWHVALRFLREGRMQTWLIVTGVAAGVAVITYIGALIAGQPRHLAHFAAKMGCWSLNCDVDFVTPALVADAHQRGLKVLAYTGDQPDDWQWLEAMGVDGVFTNHPERAR